MHNILNNIRPYFLTLHQIMRTLNLFILSIFFISNSLFAQIDKTEQEIIQTVDQYNEYYTALLKQIVNINSGTMNFQGVRSVGQKLSVEFEKLGMETRWEDGTPFGRAGHLVANTRGEKGPRLLLIGHLDTVFEPDSPLQSYSVVNDTIVKGPGIADMKGGNVIILMALKALKDIHLLEHMQIKVVMTGDEEKSGSPIELSKKTLIESAKWADIVLAFENADGDPKTIVVSRRGASSWKLKVNGNAAHSSQVFSERVGVGAIYEASRILNTFYQKLSTEENLTFSPGVILGGTSTTYDDGQNGGTAFGKTNVVAQEVIVSGDIRAVSFEQLEKAKNIMKTIVSDHYPGTTAELTFEDGGYPPLPSTAGNQQLLAWYSAVSEDLGFGPVKAVNPRNAGAADVSFTSGHVDMAVDGLGLSGADAHTVHETGDISKLPVQAKRAGVLMYRLVAGKIE